MLALYKENYLDCLRINIYIQYLSFDRLYNTGIGYAYSIVFCIIAVITTEI